MTYELAFLDIALREWRKLDRSVRDQFKKKLAERLAHPRVPSAKLSGAADRYKIKLRSLGYRLVYESANTRGSWSSSPSESASAKPYIKPRQSGRGFEGPPGDIAAINPIHVE